MSSITQVDFENNSRIKQAIEKKDINELCTIIQELELKNKNKDKTIENYKQIDTMINLVHTPNTSLSLSQKKNMIINVPKSILNEPIGSFIQDFCAHHSLREGTVLTTTLTVFNGFLQNIFKVNCQHGRELALGLYYFGDTPPSTSKSPLLETLSLGINEAIREFNDQRSAYLNNDPILFPTAVGDVTAGGLEEYMAVNKQASFNVQTTEKDFIASFLCMPPKGVSGFGMYLKAWRGEYHQSCRVQRKGLKHVRVFGSILSLAQEGTVDSIIGRNVRLGHFSDGFDARCLFTIEPPNNRGYSEKQKDFEYSIYQNTFYNIAKKLLTNYFLKINSPFFHDLITIRTTKESDILIDQCPLRYKNIFGPKADEPHMESFILKSRILIQKIAFGLYALNQCFESKEIVIDNIIPHYYFQMADELVLQYIWNHWNIFRYCDLSIEDVKKDLILSFCDSVKGSVIESVCQKLRKKPCFLSDENVSGYKNVKNTIEELIEEKEIERIPKYPNRIRRI